MMRAPSPVHLILDERVSAIDNDRGPGMVSGLCSRDIWLVSAFAGRPMPIDERWNALSPVEWDAFARAWLAELRDNADGDSDIGQRVVMMNFTATGACQWSFIEAAFRNARTDDELRHIAAGPIEHLLSKHGDDYIERIEEMSAKDTRFRKMMLTVRKHLMYDDVWNRVQALKNAGHNEDEPQR